MPFLQCRQHRRGMREDDISALMEKKCMTRTYSSNCSNNSTEHNVNDSSGSNDTRTCLYFILGNLFADPPDNDNLVLPGWWSPRRWRPVCDPLNSTVRTLSTPAPDRCSQPVLSFCAAGCSINLFKSRRT